MSDSAMSAPPQKWWHDLAWKWIQLYIVVHVCTGFGAWYLVERPTVVLFGVTVSKYSPWTFWFAYAQFNYCQMSTTCGAHRLFWHHSYQAKKWLQYCYAFGFAGVWQGPLIFWSPKHGDHHRWFDRIGDPHSPWLHGDSCFGRIMGFWWSHMGWVCTKRGIAAPSRRSIALVVADKSCGAVVLWEAKHHARLAAAYFAMPIVLGCITGDILGALLVGCFMRLCANYHLTWIVNSAGHTIGWHVEKGGKATNPFLVVAWLLGLLTWGEIYHAFHHQNPGRWQLGVRWYDADPGKWITCFWMQLRQAWETPPRRERATA